MRFTSLVCAALVFVAPTLAALKQATRADIVRREKWAPLMPRATGGPTCKREIRTAKRSEFAPDHAMFTTFDMFPGTVLPPSEVANFLLGDGMWLASNGSIAIDHEYKADLEHFRGQKWGINDWELVKAMRNKVYRWGGKSLAWHIVEGFKDPSKVFILSDDHAMPSTDIIRLMKELVEIPDWDEVMYSHHVVPRPAVEAVLHTVCPAMGPEYCD